MSKGVARSRCVACGGSRITSGRSRKTVHYLDGRGQRKPLRVSVDHDRCEGCGTRGKMVLSTENRYRVLKRKFTMHTIFRGVYNVIFLTDEISTKMAASSSAGHGTRRQLPRLETLDSACQQPLEHAVVQVAGGGEP